MLQSTKPRTTLLILTACAVALLALPPAMDVLYAEAPQRSHEGLRQARNLSSAFRTAAEAIRPSVVNISSARRIRARRGTPGRATPFDDFFDRFFGPGVPGPGEDFVRRGQGSGVIVTEDGYVLTNNHVVADVDGVEVALDDGRVLKAEVVGTDEPTDLAVLKIDAKNLRAASLGDSDALEVGDWVIAAGSPFGLRSSITAGIVSAKGRSGVGLADYEDFIQTDAAINPGNSGGPLVNLSGEVVGINTAILTRTGTNMGIGLAIPATMARNVMRRLIDDGRVVRGWFGAVVQDVDEGLAASFGFEGTDGVLIGDVLPGGPADEAGIRPGDIVQRFGGKPTKSMESFRTLVADTEPGRKVDVVVFRDGSSKTLQLEVGERDADEPRAHEMGDPDELGLTVSTLTPSLGRRFGLDPDARGVVVTDVEPLSPAERAGLRPGEVILRVQGEEVASVDGFRRALGRHDLESGVRLAVQAGDAKRFAFLRKR